MRDREQTTSSSNRILRVESDLVFWAVSFFFPSLYLSPLPFTAAGPG